MAIQAIIARGVPENLQPVAPNLANIVDQIRNQNSIKGAKEIVDRFDVLYNKERLKATNEAENKGTRIDIIASLGYATVFLSYIIPSMAGYAM